MSTAFISAKYLLLIPITVKRTREKTKKVDQFKYVEQQEIERVGGDSCGMVRQGEDRVRLEIKEQ